MGELHIAKSFWTDVSRLPTPTRAKVVTWLSAFMTTPDDPRREAHRVRRSVMPDLWTAKLDDAYRVIYRQTSSGDRFLLICDHHDAAYRRCLTYRAVTSAGAVSLVESAEPPAEPAPHRLRLRRRRSGRTFAAWSDRDLRSAGLPGHLLDAVRGCDSEDDLLELAASAGSYGDFLLKLYEDGPPTLVGSAASRPTVGLVESALRTPVASASVVAVGSTDELARILSKPIEDWMIFLHPAQSSIAQRRTFGPARVRGAAGTGKTVVALHRAAFIARTLDRRGDPAPILFTTYISSLPVVLKSLFERLAPDVAGRVEFVNVHRWALALLRDRGLPHRVDPQATRRAFRQALATAAGRRLLASGLSRGYLDEEVQYFVKGRALGSLDEYLRLPRTSRGTPLRAQQRSDLWQVATTYRSLCVAAGAQDFADLLFDAMHSLREAPLERPYAAIVIDETQDLTEAGLRMLMAALRRDGELLLVGDGQQSIYPGSFSLRSLGLEVRGRSAVLTTSYRNSAEVTAAAMRMMEGHAFDDQEDEAAAPVREVIPLRHGEAPLLVRLGDAERERRWVVEDVARRHAAGVDLGDMAVFFARNADASALLDELKQAGLAAQSLDQYQGRTTHAIKVGTYFRAKGLEFKEVYLPHASDGSLPPTTGTGDPDEIRELARRRFFVGMTRARDRLTITYSGRPSPFLGPLISRRGLVRTLSG